MKQLKTTAHTVYVGIIRLYFLLYANLANKNGYQLDFVRPFRHRFYVHGNTFTFCKSL